MVTHAQEREVLTFTLSGLSKISALPQMKLAWIVVSGPAELRSEAHARLEVIADTYFSVSAPVASGHARVACAAGAIQAQISRAGTKPICADSIHMLTPALPLSRLKVEGGWYAILRVPSTRSDEDWAAELLTKPASHCIRDTFTIFPPKAISS